MRRREARRRGGFSLLEVLAAVALLAILYTTLAGVAIQGLRAEGVSLRRLEASMVADERIAEIELQMDASTVPPEGVTEEEEDRFVVTVTVEPFEVPFPEPEPGDDRAESVLSTLQLLSPTAEAPLRRIAVKVAWKEAEDDYAVERTTFGFDLLAVESLLQASGGLSALGSPNDSTGQDSLEDQLP